MEAADDPLPSHSGLGRGCDGSPPFFLHIAGAVIDGDGKPLADRAPLGVGIIAKCPRSTPSRAGKGLVDGWRGFLIASLLVFVFALSLPPWAREANYRPGRTQLVVLSSEYEGLFPTLHLDQYGLAAGVHEVFRATEADYLALEARFAKRQRQPDVHLQVTILSFRDEAAELEKRFWAKLEAFLGPAT